MRLRRLVIHHSSVLLAATFVPFAWLACESTAPSRSQMPAGAPLPSASQAAASGAQSAEAGDMVCQTYCSPLEPGMPVAEIRFVLAAQPAGAENLRKLAAGQNVDATVYEDGFDRGLFVRLPSVTPQARFAPAGQPAGAKPLPGLDRLIVNAMSTSQDAAGALRLASPAEGGRENVVLQVQGLQPGMNYYWRVRPASQAEPQVVMCRAPICPTDRRP